MAATGSCARAAPCCSPSPGSRDYWRFTPQSLDRLLRPVFGDGVRIAAHGNVLAATAMLHGIVTEELTAAELAKHDPNYPVAICAVATKATA